jgi:hypothetical protein
MPEKPKAPESIPLQVGDTVRLREGLPDSLIQALAPDITKDTIMKIVEIRDSSSESRRNPDTGESVTEEWPALAYVTWKDVDTPHPLALKHLTRLLN